MAVAYIEGWITLKDDVSYVNLVLGVIREISTYIRNEIPKITQYREQYYWRKKHEIFKLTRFDVMEDAIKKESNKNIHNQKYNETMQSRGSRICIIILFWDKSPNQSDVVSLKAPK